MTPTERLQQDFLIALFRALDPERNQLPGAPTGRTTPHAGGQPIIP